MSYENPTKPSLYGCACRCDLPGVQRMIKEGANLEVKGSTGMTALHHACVKHVPEIVDALLEAGADVNAVTACGDTPLHLAARHGNASTIRKLLIKGANIEFHNKQGETPLCNCPQWIEIGVIEALLEGNADPNNLPANNHGLLHKVCRIGRSDAAEKLLKHKADPNIKDEDGYTPLHIAAMRGHGKVCNLLMDAGASTTLTTGKKQREGQTASQLARRMRHPIIADRIIRKTQLAALNEQ